MTPTDRSPSPLLREAVTDGVIAALANALDEFDEPLTARELLVLDVVLAEMLRLKSLDIFRAQMLWSVHPLLSPHDFSKREIADAFSRLHQTNCLVYVPGRGKRASYVGLRPFDLARPQSIGNHLEI